jgi:hypothetical protein
MVGASIWMFLILLLSDEKKKETAGRRMKRDKIPKKLRKYLIHVRTNSGKTVNSYDII